MNNVFLSARSIINAGNSKKILDIANIGANIIIYGFLLPHRVYFASLSYPSKNWERAIVKYPIDIANPARNGCNPYPLVYNVSNAHPSIPSTIEVLNRGDPNRIFLKLLVVSLLISSVSLIIIHKITLEFF